MSVLQFYIQGGREGRWRVRSDHLLEGLHKVLEMLAITIFELLGNHLNSWSDGNSGMDTARVECLRVRAERTISCMIRPLQCGVWPDRTMTLSNHA